MCRPMPTRGKWGSSIKISKWKLFLEGHRFAKTNCMGTVEIDTKKLDLIDCSWLSYHLLLLSLVGIDVVRTPDLGREGAHAGGLASRREEVHPRHMRTISSSSISISSETTGLPSPSRHHRIFRRRSIAVTVARMTMTLIKTMRTTMRTPRRPFAAPPSRHLIVPDGCCVVSRHAAVLSTHRAALSAIKRPHHRRQCTPSTADTAATTAATCVVERFTLVH